MNMTIANWCLVLAGLLPVFTVAIAKWGDRSFDNHAPRAWMERQSGLRQRADYAHRNHFEAFPFFAAAVLVAQQAGAPQGQVDLIAMLFIGARLVYTALYLSDRASARSAVWVVGLLCNLALFAVTALHH